MALHYGPREFRITKSFLFDGVDERFTIPQAALQNTITDSGGTFSISAMLKRNSAPVTNKCWFSKNGSSIYCRFANNKIEFRIYYLAVATLLRTVNTFDDTNQWYFITCTMDQNLSTGACAEIYVNGVAQTYDQNTISNITAASNDTWKIGIQGSSNQFDGYIQSLSVENKVLTLADHQSYYNNGKPKNPLILFGTTNKYFFNADASSNTAQFTVTDSVNLITATSVNMEDADKTNETPY